MEQAQVSYTFDKCLGRGGYGEVYLATRTRKGGLTKRVAVKVLRSGIARETEALHRLRDEGRMLAMLDHPAILAVHEMTRVDGRVALVTEYVEGVDIARCCKRGFLLPPRVVLGIIGEVAAALHTAFTTPSPETSKPLALVHRDIKPENIRLSKHGQVKLLDFGIARSTEMAREAETAAGALPFTPGYAAPECFRRGEHGAPSDVYALGATAYRMLVGERLMEGLDTGSQLTLVNQRERFERFLRKRLTKVDADPRIRDLLEEMLSFEADQRPTAAQVQLRCETLGDDLEGPTHVRWARGTRFSEPQGIPGAQLTGRCIEADAVDDMDQQVPIDQVPAPDRTDSPLVPQELGADDAMRSGATDSLPIPDHGLHTLPGAERVSSVPHDDDETLVLDDGGGGVGALVVKVALGLTLLISIGTVVLAVIVVVLWFYLG